MSETIRIIEVGPRDGLQNESASIPTTIKAAFVHALIYAGLTEIEVTSFVHPKSIPQLADADELVREVGDVPGVRISALVPNQRGLERAIQSGIRHIAVFTAASDTFAQRNINVTVDESLKVFAPVAKEAIANGMTVRGYVSTAFVCPYEGEILPQRVREVTARLFDLGVQEVAISDTIGAAAPNDIQRTVGHLLESFPAEDFALHLHDTLGTALANVCAGLDLGIRAFDSSAGGLGGCPYAPGAAGNLATEDLVYLLERMGYRTGVSIENVFAASCIIAGQLGRDLPGKQFQRLRAAENPRT